MADLLLIYAHPRARSFNAAIARTVLDALEKGYLDKVFRELVTYRFPPGDDGSGVPEGLLSGRAALVLNTSDTPPDREHAVFGDPLDGIWRDCVFGFSGVTDVHRHTFRPVAGSSDGQRRRWLEEAGALARDLLTRV